MTKDIKVKMKNELSKKTINEVVEFFSPARINLIGEHIDYVGGLVLPAAINLGINAFAAKSDNIEIKSINFGEKWTIKNNFSFDVVYDKENSFMNFVYGTLIELKKVVKNKINEKSGFKLILSSSIPIASGLSSSAAFGMLILEIMDQFYELGLDKIKKAQIFQKVENNFIKLKSGIMDQFAIGLGKKDKFIQLDTSTLDYKYISAGQDDYGFILISTNKSRELADSGYNQRVDELTEVAKILDKEFKTLSTSKLSDLTKIKDKTLNKRLKHVITEVERVGKVVKNLKSMKGEELGKIINQSHTSLANDYNVSCDELNYIHNKLNQLKGVFGSRMIGAGFGGCMLAIVSKNFKINSIKFNKDYHKKFGINFDVYEFQIENGTRKVLNDTKNN